MAVPFFLALSHLLLLQYSVSSVQDNNIKNSCPSSFSCQSLQPFSFPLTNSTKYSSCGLFMVICDAPKPQRPQINLGNNWFEIIGDNISQQANNKVQLQIRNKWLQVILNDYMQYHISCEMIGTQSLTNTPIISYAILHSLTLFRCNKSDSDQAFKGFDNYTLCEGYNLYYKYPGYDYQHDQSVPPLPPSCSVIQLPINSFNLKNPNLKDDPYKLFKLLTANFSLELQLSDGCMKCHERGGQCQIQNQKLHCTIKQGKTDLTLTLGTVAAGIGIIAVLLFFIIRKLPQMESIIFWKNITDDCRNVEAFLKNYGPLSPKRYTYSDIKKMTNSFSNKLGQGGYGCVFKGKLENGCLVAVKVLKGVKGSGEEFINEVATISRTSHVNVVTFLGFCFEGHNRALIYEFMPNGSLEKFIYDGNSLTNRQLGWDTLYRIAIGIARGLEYLHRGCNTRILHFDIKPHNILLDDDFCPKISDFGLAKICSPKDSTVSLLGARGTAGYIAPEVFSRNFGEVSHKSDVYSFGMMILEMVGGRKNIQIEVDRTSEIYFPHWIYKRLDLDEELGLHGIVNDEAKESARKMIIVGLWCIQTNPLHRPSMNRVVEMLEGSLESLRIPPKPFLSSPPSSPADSSTTPILLN